MHAKNFALWSGAALVIIASLSFIPTLWFSGAGIPDLQLDFSYGLFLGLFPMNLLSKLVLMAFGLAGWICSKDFVSSVHFARFTALTLGAMAFLGMVPATNTLFGFWPLFGGAVVLHAFFALIASYFGYVELRATQIFESRSGYSATV